MTKKAKKAMKDLKIEITADKQRQVYGDYTGETEIYLK